MNRLVRRTVDRLFAFDPSMPDAHARREELVRETSVMVLYLSVVLLATLTVLPADYGRRVAEDEHGGPSVLAIVWGTTLGLALAHWFAFRLATSALGGGRPSRHDVTLGVAQVVGACLVAAATSVAVLVAGPTSDVRAAVFVPAGFIGVAGYGVARAAGRSRSRSTLDGVLVLGLGLLVAAVKVWSGSH